MRAPRALRRSAAEWRQVTADAIEEGEAARSCPYFRGVGGCQGGCYTEPRCQTDTPHYGWPRRAVIRGGRRVVFELRPRYRRPYVWRNPGSGRTW